MVLGIILTWAIMAWSLLEDNMEILEELAVWKAGVITVILIISAPVFFLSDMLEFLLSIIIGEEEE